MEDLMKNISFENCELLPDELKKLLSKNGADLTRALKNSESLASKSHENVPMQSDVQNILDAGSIATVGTRGF